MFDLYIIEASTDLADWTRLAMLPRTNNGADPLLFQDTNADGLSHRFYRTFTNHLITMFPKPTGSFAVGTFNRVMIDPARTNRYRYSPATNAFMVTFLYPAQAPRAGALPVPKMNQRLAADTSYYSLGGADTGWAILTPRFVGHRFSDLPLAANQDRFPVLLFSHCLPTHRDFNSQIAEELASHGYVVIAPDHSDCFKTEFPDGRYLTGNWAGDSDGRFKDFHFLLDELERLNVSDPFFAGRLDLDRIGIYGHVYGGMVAEVCRRDDRVKCVALLEAENLRVPDAGLQKPFLAMNHAGSPRLAQNQALFNQATTNALWLQVSGADPHTFSDLAWGTQVPWGRQPALAIDACLVWFFDTYLNGETPPFPTHPELINVQRK
jgi:dienelactone hydrolase